MKKSKWRSRLWALPCALVTVMFVWVGFGDSLTTSQTEKICEELQESESLTTWASAWLHDEDPINDRDDDRCVVGLTVLAGDSGLQSDLSGIVNANKVLADCYARGYVSAAPSQPPVLFIETISSDGVIHFLRDQFFVVEKPELNTEALAEQIALAMVDPHERTTCPVHSTV